MSQNEEKDIEEKKAQSKEEVDFAKVLMDVQQRTSSQVVEECKEARNALFGKNDPQLAEITDFKTQFERKLNQAKTSLFGLRDLIKTQINNRNHSGFVNPDSALFCYISIQNLCHLDDAIQKEIQSHMEDQEQKRNKEINKFERDVQMFLENQTREL